MSISKENLSSIVNCHLGSDAVSISFIEEGIETTAKIELSGGDSVVFKAHETERYDQPRGFLGGPEMLSIVNAADVGIPVPEVHYTSGIDGGELGTPFYIMEHVPNDSYTPQTLSRDCHRKLVYECGRILGDLHQIDTETNGFGWAGRVDKSVQPFDGGYDRFEEFLNERWAEFRKRLNSGGRYAEDENVECRFDDVKDEIVQLQTLLEEEQPLTECQPRYCHGDFTYDNILVSVGNDIAIRGVIDWATPVLGDPLYDFARGERLLIDKFNEEFTAERKRTLRNAYCNGYTSVQNTDVTTQNARIRLGFYRINTVIRCMVNFPVWFNDHSTDEKEAAEDYYRNRYQTLKQRLLSTLS